MNAFITIVLALRHVKNSDKDIFVSDMCICGHGTGPADVD